ncbi:hypothetical protein F4860DRAFT_434606 [Xylaria cubensis]|nr:hypothetical protein F4860DRAFT_434606 [Xylaria cubensis]
MRPQQLSTDPVPWRPSHTQSCLFQPFPPLSFHAFSRPTSARGRTHQHGRLRLFLPGLVKDLAIWGRLLIVALSLTSGAPFFSFCFALSVSIFFSFFAGHELQTRWVSWSHIVYLLEYGTRGRVLSSSHTILSHQFRGAALETWKFHPSLCSWISQGTTYLCFAHPLLTAAVRFNLSTNIWIVSTGARHLPA